MTLRARLVVALVVVTVVVVATGTVVVLAQRDYLVQQVDNELSLASSPVIHIPGLGPSPDGGGPAPGPFPGNGAGNGSTSGSSIVGAGGGVTGGRTSSGGVEVVSDLWIGTIDSSGSLTSVPTSYSSRSVPDVTGVTAAAHPDKVPFTVAATSGSSRFRVVALNGRDGSTVVVARSLDGVDAAVRRLILGVGGGVAATVVVLGLVGWWVWRLGLRPIRRMTETAVAITAGNVGDRVEEVAPGTEAGRLAVALNAMLDERQRVEGRLRQFVGDASHELRTPLTSIRGYADLYQRGGLVEADRLDDAMRRIAQESVRMGDLVEELLTLARLDQQQPIAAEPVDLVPILEDAAADARVVAPGRSITVDVPGGPDGLFADGDEHRLRQVVAALVSNAMNHTDGSIVVRGVGRSDGVVVEVEDEGPGMSPELAARAFDRFSRGDPARTRHRGGAGLGLAVVSSVVTAHHGTVELDTGEDRGTIVRVVIPAAGPDPRRVPSTI